MAMTEKSGQAVEISLLHRAVAAGGASIVSSLVVNPLDVVKTRIQAQGTIPAVNTSLLEKWNFAGCGPTCVRLSNPKLVCGPDCEHMSYKGTWHALRTISRTEGLGALWRGTRLALAMSIPMVGIYLPLYDSLLERFQDYGTGVYAPLFSGMVARAGAVYCTAPFELLRTRVQAGRGVALPVALSSQTAALSQEQRYKSFYPSVRTVKKLWTGVGATLARDVPFSGLYWAFVEPIRAAIMPRSGPQSETDILLVNVVAGGTAGALAGAITTPLDVAKTRTQLDGHKTPLPLTKMLRRIAAREGMAGLFQGWSARSAKAAPACAIVLSAYEMIKFMPMAGDTVGK